MTLAVICSVYFLWMLPKISEPFGILLDIYYDFITNLAKSNIGKHYKFLLPFISSLFLFILIGNLIGFIPPFFTYTSHFAVNACLSSMVIFGTLIISIVRNGFETIRLFFPSGVPILLFPLLFPIEFILFFAKILTLAVRLTINISVGHIISKVFLGIAETFGILGSLFGLIYIPVLGLEICTSCLQAYIFVIISCITLKDAVESHH